MEKETQDFIAPYIMIDGVVVEKPLSYVPYNGHSDSCDCKECNIMYDKFSNHINNLAKYNKALKQAMPYILVALDGRIEDKPMSDSMHHYYVAIKKEVEAMSFN